MWRVTVRSQVAAFPRETIETSQVPLNDMPERDGNNSILGNRGRAGARST